MDLDYKIVITHFIIGSVSMIIVNIMDNPPKKDYLGWLILSPILSLPITVIWAITH